MTPVFLFLLFLSLTAVPPGAANNGTQIDESSDISEILAKANEGTRTRLTFDDIRPSVAKNAAICTYRGCKWPKYGRYVYVPVIISSRYNWRERNIIIRALVHFHRTTCIRFRWRSNQRNYLYFYPGSGCWSYLGRQRRGQAISLKKNGCVYTKTVQHEVLHALGFHHEQVRSDRDRYVRILYQNIKPGKKSNFRKVWTNNLGTRYDYNSVMHYHKYAFSRNGRPTIVAKYNPYLSFGRARQMSASDIARVNRLYRCRV